jgi:hypothetical protein
MMPIHDAERHRWVSKYTNILKVVQKANDEPPLDISYSTPILVIKDSSFPMHRNSEYVWEVTMEHPTEAVVIYEGQRYDLGRL